MVQVEAFLADCCERVPGQCVRVKDLYAAYGAWCADHGEQPLAKIAFGGILTTCGIGVHGGSGRHGDLRTDIVLRDGRHLALATPQPVANESDGQVVLSLHYQAGMRVRPARVRLEQAVDSQDTIPFVRLRMSEPVGRILITWEGR